MPHKALEKRNAISPTQILGGGKVGTVGVASAGGVAKGVPVPIADYKTEVAQSLLLPAKATAYIALGVDTVTLEHPFVTSQAPFVFTHGDDERRLYNFAVQIECVLNGAEGVILAGFVKRASGAGYDAEFTIGVLPLDATNNRSAVEGEALLQKDEQLIFEARAYNPTNAAINLSVTKARALVYARQE